MWHDTTAADDKALQERGLANSTEKEATFLFDSSMTCAQWLQKGKEDMKAENYEEAASNFYQAMVGQNANYVLFFFFDIFSTKFYILILLTRLTYMLIIFVIYVIFFLIFSIFF
tara:strand:- start:657 stop:998 length:342 start_codon:yes stop_codon:yes gene_type:complete